MVFHIFGTKGNNSCEFPREIIIAYQQNSKTLFFFAYFPRAVQIEAIPYPLASILENQLLLFEGDFGGCPRPFQIKAGLTNNSGNCFYLCVQEYNVSSMVFRRKIFQITSYPCKNNFGFTIIPPASKASNKFSKYAWSRGATYLQPKNIPKKVFHNKHSST